MRITQGTFSYLPELTDEQIEKQIAYGLRHSWAIMIEHTDDPHPRNSLWEMWREPWFDTREDQIGEIMSEVGACRETFPNEYIKIVEYNRRLGRQSPALSFIINRPDDEPGFRLDRQEKANRHMRYTVHSYAAEQPHGRRYGAALEPDGAPANGKANGKAPEGDD